MQTEAESMQGFIYNGVFAKLVLQFYQSFFVDPLDSYIS